MNDYEWKLTVTPTVDGYCITQESEDLLSDLVCSRVAQIVREALHDLVQPAE